MKLLFVILFFVFPILSLGSWMPAKLKVTADNGYAVYVGSSEKVMYLGSDWADNANEASGQIGRFPAGPLGKYNTAPAVIPLYLDATAQSIYIVTWSDATDTQGGLFDVVINGVQISSDNPAWKVYPTGYFAQPKNGAPYPPSFLPACEDSSEKPFDRSVGFGADHTSPPCPDWVAEMILDADIRGLWKIPTRGDRNDGSSLTFPPVPEIPGINKWMWYASSSCPASIAYPFDNARQSCQHQEPLIFAIPVTAAAADPGACRQMISNITKTQFCGGQCPYRPDGTVPHCDTIFTSTGVFRGCECCQPCDVVVMPDITQNYCSGFCESCQQCEVADYGYINPQDPSTRYIKSCSCQRVNPTGQCDVDRCNNVCVGDCPDPRFICNATYSSIGQALVCNCTSTSNDPCQLTYNPPYGYLCSGQCTTSDTKCKGFFVNGYLRDCSCDCCELYQDPKNPGNNYCEGKCDSPNAVCLVTGYSDFQAEDGTTVQAPSSCGCKLT